MEIEEKTTEPTARLRFPTFTNVDWSLVLAVVSLVAVLFPQILSKLYAFSAKAQAGLTADALIFSSSFNAFTLFVGLILALWALISNRNVYATRIIALLALIVAVLKLVLPV